MRTPNRSWILASVVLALVASACTGSNIDDGSSADVVLQVLDIQAPAVTGQVTPGTCSSDASISCTSNETCSLAGAGVCVFTDTGQNTCIITEWSITMTNLPKSELAVTSPFNDVLIQRSEVTYTWPNGNPAPSTTVTEPLGFTVPASSTGTYRFFPISQTELNAGAGVGNNSSVNLSIVLRGQTYAGDPIQVLTGRSLFIENCVP